jgi:PRC-barrel domain
MASTSTADARLTGHPLIASDRVEGTAVLRPTGEKIGSIERVMIEKVSGRVAYAVMAFGGLLGVGHRHFTLPWSTLTYDESLDGYVVNISEEQLKAAPDYDREGEIWSDRTREEELHRYYDVPPYWGI